MLVHSNIQEIVQDRDQCMHRLMVFDPDDANGRSSYVRHILHLFVNRLIDYNRSIVAALIDSAAAKIT